MVLVQAQRWQCRSVLYHGLGGWNDRCHRSSNEGAMVRQGGLHHGPSLLRRQNFLRGVISPKSRFDVPRIGCCNDPMVVWRPCEMVRLATMRLVQSIRFERPIGRTKRFVRFGFVLALLSPLLWAPAFKPFLILVLESEMILTHRVTWCWRCAMLTRPAVPDSG